MEVRIASIWITLTGFVAAAALFAGGYWVGMASAAEAADVTPAEVAFPDWFLPIWDAYDRNPAVTPEFDFAALYSGDLRTSPR